MTDFTISVALGGHTGWRHDEDGRHEDWIDTFSIQAITPRGDVFELDGSQTYKESVARDMLETLDDCNPETAPERWIPCAPVYGSDAWDDDAEYDLACFEADCFDEPRPRWF